jgi:hypothetical protein
MDQARAAELHKWQAVRLVHPSHNASLMPFNGARELLDVEEVVENIHGGFS